MVVKIRDKIKQVEITKLQEYDKNNKIHTEEQISLLVQMIDKFGFTTPLLIDSKNVLIAGHGRKAAAERLGMKKLPCIVIDDLSDAEIKTLRIADNRIGELAETSMLNIKEEYMDLLESGSGIEFLTGYTEDDFSDLLEEDNQEVSEDDFEAPEDVTEIKTDIKLGDVIKLGNHRLMCGSSTEVEDVEKLTEQNKLDMCFTDPPYGVSAVGGRTQTKISKGMKEIKNDNLRDDELNLFLTKAFDNIQIKDSGTFYICYDQQTQEEFINSIKNTGLNFKKTLVWNKNVFGLSPKGYRPKYELIAFGCKGNNYDWFGGTDQADVWDIPRPTERPGNHPTPKPIELCAKAIENSSKQGQTVLDLFGGSGSTLIACEQLNRKCYMMELDEKYCEVICQRWEKLTGKTREVL